MEKSTGPATGTLIRHAAQLPAVITAVRGSVGRVTALGTVPAWEDPSVNAMVNVHAPVNRREVNEPDLKAIPQVDVVADLFVLLEPNSFSDFANRVRHRAAGMRSIG